MISGGLSGLNGREVFHGRGAAHIVNHHGKRQRRASATFIFSGRRVTIRIIDDMQVSQTRSAPSESIGEDPVKLLLWVGTSRIAGRGLFTAQAIKRGTRIIQYTGEKIPKGESDKRLAAGNDYIFQLNERYDIDGKVLRNKARYINHSCAPNCTVQMTTRTIWIVALRDITAGEELTYNYGYELDDAPTHPCTCGAENCCGSILAPQYQEVVKHRRAIARGL
jgi:uncharacterized protein